MRYLLENLGFRSSSRDFASAAKLLSAYMRRDPTSEAIFKRSIIRAPITHLGYSISPWAARDGLLGAVRARRRENEPNSTSTGPFASDVTNLAATELDAPVEAV